MSELKIPTIEMLTAMFQKERLVSPGEAKAVAEATLKAYRQPFDPDGHPICAVLGEKGFNDICNINYQMMADGVKTVDRLDRVTAVLDEKMNTLFASDPRKAAAFEREWAEEAKAKKLALTDHKALSGKFSALGSWWDLIKKYIKFEGRTYSSIRSGSASGTSGSGWNTKWRTLRVVNATQSSNITATLFGIPISSTTVVAGLVTSTHWRMPGGLWPTAGNPLVAGATRNGVTKSNSNNAAIVSKAYLFTDHDPNLVNLTWFGESDDANIHLYVSGTP